MILNHTPTPWKLDAHLLGQVVSQDDTKLIARAGRVEPIADLDQVERAANAEFIVRACNAHAQLVGALTEMLDQHQNGIAGISQPCAARARAALAAAGAA